MAFVPKSVAPRPRKKLRGRSYTPHKSEGDTKPPRKPRKIKQVDFNDEEAVRLASQESAARQYKARKADVFSHAKDATKEQQGFLRSLMGGFEECPTPVMIRFVEFANQLPSGAGTMNKWDRQRTWLSRIYWIRAIDMMQKGSNDLTSAREEIAVSFGYETVMDMEFGGDLFSLPPLPQAP